MNDIGIIDRFTNVFSQYIDSGFGLLGNEVSFLTAALIAIDMTLAGIFWAMEGEDVLPKLLRKTLHVGAFAFILTNFKELADIIFNSFAGLGLTATDSTLTAADLLRPGRLAAVGVDAARPLMNQIADLVGFPDVFHNLDTIVVLLLTWVVVILCFFILAVQLFVAIIEFKLTTLAGFVLVPFAMWNKTAFLAERVLGNVVSSGIKILVLAVIVGIGTSLFAEMVAPANADLTISDALATMLASLAMFVLGIFGPGIANGLVAGAPQLGAESAAGAALALGGGAAMGAKALGAATRATGGVAGAAGITAGKTAVAGYHGYQSFKTGMNASGATGMTAVASGAANVARDGGKAIASRAHSAANRIEGAIRQKIGLPPRTPSAAESSPTREAQAQVSNQPGWATRLNATSVMTGGQGTAYSKNGSGGSAEQTTGEGSPSH